MKSVAQAMTFEDLPLKPVRQAVVRSQARKDREGKIDYMPTYEILWYVIRRHKFELVTIWAICASVVAVVKF